MKRIRTLITVLSFWCCIFGTVAICQQRSVNEQARIDERLSEVRARLDDMKGVDSRVVRLEEAVKNHTEQLTEIQWWARWIGGALILSVLDKVMGRLDKSKGKEV